MHAIHIKCDENIFEGENHCLNLCRFQVCDLFCADFTLADFTSKLPSCKNSACWFVHETYLYRINSFQHMIDLCRFQSCEWTSHLLSLRLWGFHLCGFNSCRFHQCKFSSSTVSNHSLKNKNVDDFHQIYEVTCPGREARKQFNLQFLAHDSTGCSKASKMDYYCLLMISL